MRKICQNVIMSITVLMILCFMSIKTEAAVPTDYTGYYNFDDNLDNGAEGGEAATLTGERVTETAILNNAKYTEGTIGKAIDFDGTYGLKLGKLLTENEYTVSFDINLHEATFGTAAVFIESMKGDRSKERWTCMVSRF